MLLNQPIGLNALRQDLNRLFYSAPIAGQAFGQGFAANSFYAPQAFYAAQGFAPNSVYGAQAWTPAVSLQANSLQAVAQQYGQQPMMGQPVHFVPKANAAETPEAVFYTVELPGVELSQIALSIHGNVLVLEGVRQPGGLIGDRMISYQHAEGRFGAFRWVAPVQNGCVPAAIEATMRNGLLTIILPKAGAPIVANTLSNQTGITAAPVAQLVINQAVNA